MNTKNCKVCNLEFEGHFNSSLCSIECKKKAKNTTNRKYTSTKKQIAQTALDNDTMEGEIWKDIINYEGIYKISNKGRIKANIRKGGGGIMKTNVSTGYHCVSLRKAPNEKIKHFGLHRLLAVHFLENPNNLPVVDHIDRNPLNNNLSNLRWVTVSDNNLNQLSGSICETKDKVGDKIYTYYRVTYRENKIRKQKRFKNMNDANNFLLTVRK